jgi:hypothetical protein
MAAGTTQIVDVIVPELFTPYTQQLTEEKSRLIRSGAVALDPFLSAFLAGGGLTIHAPSWKDLDNDAENVSTDAPGDVSTPNKNGAIQEIAVRLSRNNSWKTADLTEALAGSDPMDSIANRVADYWVRRLQAAYIAAMKGVFADNDAAPTGTEHVAGDLTFDASGVGYVDGVTNFSAENYINAKVTMGDSMDQLSLIMVHSIVYARMQKNNMIDFVPDANQQIMIPKFLDATVIVDDAMPFSSGVFDSWLFGPAAMRLGTGAPKVPTETMRYPDQGNGGGTEALFNRVEWCLHPKGHRYAGTPPNGGPSNAATSNNLAHAGSWQRVFTERKQIKIARLRTRES